MRLYDTEECLINICEKGGILYCLSASVVLGVTNGECQNTSTPSVKRSCIGANRALTLISQTFVG